MNVTKIYDLLYQIAASGGLDGQELESQLITLDRLSDLGTEDLTEILYRLAEDGDLDESELVGYLERLDQIIASKAHKP